jgi:multidrug efflux pump subunit AcrA (membrane-fusion protein)
VISDNTGQQYVASIASVASAPTRASSGGNSDDDSDELYYSVQIRTVRRLPPALQGLPVRVTVQKSASSGPVLSVPSSAVSSQADGTTVVTVQQRAGVLRTVPVTTGASGNGYVEVRPTSGTLRAGDDVVVGS